MSAPTPRGPRPTDGPPLLAPAVAYAVLALAGIVVPALMAGEMFSAGDRQLLDFYRAHAAAGHALAFFVMASAVPLAIWAAIVSARLRVLGFDVPGRTIALAGGITAAALLTVSGATSLALVQPDVAGSAPTVRAFYGLAGAAGGPGFVSFMALLLLGVGIPMFLGRLGPRWVSIFGLIIAAAATLAVFTAAFAGLTFLLPIGRFGSLVWMIAVSLTLPKERRPAQAAGVTP